MPSIMRIALSDVVVLSRRSRRSEIFLLTLSLTSSFGAVVSFGAMVLFGAMVSFGSMVPSPITLVQLYSGIGSWSPSTVLLSLLLSFSGILFIPGSAERVRT